MSAATFIVERMDKGTVIQVGDTLDVEGHGSRCIVRQITVCLEPSTDPAGEVSGVQVEACEIGLPFVVDISVGGDLKWAYASQIRAVVSPVAA